MIIAGNVMVSSFRPPDLSWTNQNQNVTDMQGQEPALTKVGDALATFVKLRDELVTF